MQLREAEKGARKSLQGNHLLIMMSVSSLESIDISSTGADNGSHTSVPNMIQIRAYSRQEPSVAQGHRACHMSVGDGQLPNERCNQESKVDSAFMAC